MKVYLAGRIQKGPGALRERGGWRSKIVRGFDGIGYDDWAQAINGGVSDTEFCAVRWPIMEAAIKERHDYVGPYAMGCDHGCGHGPHTHGMAIGIEGCFWNRGGPIIRRHVVSLCLAAIVRCDLLFAWLDGPEAHGTLVEIGYALALGKRVYVAIQNGCPSESELWFALHAVGAAREVRGYDLAEDAAMAAIKAAETETGR